MVVILTLLTLLVDNNLVFFFAKIKKKCQIHENVCLDLSPIDKTIKRKKNSTRENIPALNEPRD